MFALGAMVEMSMHRCAQWLFGSLHGHDLFCKWVAKTCFLFYKLLPHLTSSKPNSW